MDRSRSPHRDAAPVAGTRPLVNFPVWSGPNIPDNAARGPGLPSNQGPTQSWHQGPRGLQPSQGLPLTQDSQQIPPGQVGPSQHCVGLSQQSGFIPQNRGYHPGYGTPVAPRPHWTWGYGILIPPYSTYLDFKPISWTSSWPFSTTTIWTRNSSSFLPETYSDHTIKSIELWNTLFFWKDTNGQNPKPTSGPTLETRRRAL